MLPDSTAGNSIKGGFRSPFRGFVRITACCLALSAGCRSAEKLSSWSHKDDLANQATSEKLASQIEKESPGLTSKAAQAQSTVTVDEHIKLGQQEVFEWYRDQSSTRLAAARRHFGSALEKAPQSSGAHHGLAIVADLEKNYAEAERHYQQALIQKPNDSTILGDMGYSYLLQDRLSESEQYSLRAVQADQANTNAMKHLGDAYARQGKTQLAQEAYAKVYAPDDIPRQLAENAPKKPAEHVTKSNTSMFDRLNITKSPADRLRNDIQQRFQEQEAQQQQKAASAGFSMASQHGPGPQPQPQRERMSQEMILRQQLLAIEQEGAPQVSSGTILVDDQTGQLTRLPGAENQQGLGQRGVAAANFGAMNVAVPSQQQGMGGFGQAPPLAQQSSSPYFESQRQVPNGAYSQQGFASQPSGNEGQYPSGQQLSSTPTEARQPQYPQRVTNAGQKVWNGIQLSDANSGPQDQNPNQQSPVRQAPVQQAVQEADMSQSSAILMTNGQLAAQNGPPPGNYGMNPGSGTVPPSQFQQGGASRGTMVAGNQPMMSGSGDRPGGNFASSSMMQNPAQAGTANGSIPGAGQNNTPNSYQEASKAAARMGMGVGAGGMFPVINQPQTITPPGSLSYDRSGAQPPQRWMPDDLNPPDLNRAFQPVPDNPRPPANSQREQFPADIYPSYGVDQFGTASRYDTRTMQSTNVPQDYNMAMQGYENQRWVAGREANLAVQEIWDRGPVNSPVSPTAGSSYQMPHTQGMMYTPNAPNLNGPGLTPEPWPYQQYAPQGDPQQNVPLYGQSPEELQQQNQQMFSQQFGGSQQYNQPQFNQPQQQFNQQQSQDARQNSAAGMSNQPGMNQNQQNIGNPAVQAGQRASQFAPGQNGTTTSGNRNQVVIPSDYRSYSNSSMRPSPPANSGDNTSWPTIIPASR